MISSLLKKIEKKYAQDNSIALPLSAEQLFNAVCAWISDNVGKLAPYIGDNGNWYLYNLGTETYEDTGVPADTTISAIAEGAPEIAVTDDGFQLTYSDGTVTHADGNTYSGFELMFTLPLIGSDTVSVDVSKDGKAVQIAVSETYQDKIDAEFTSVSQDVSNLSDVVLDLSSSVDELSAHVSELESAESDLNAVVTEGFADLDARVTNLSKSVSQDVSNLADVFADLDISVDKLSARVSKLESAESDLNAVVTEGFADLDARVTNLSKSVSQDVSNLADVFADLDISVDKLSARVSKLESSENGNHLYQHVAVMDVSKTDGSYLFLGLCVRCLSARSTPYTSRTELLEDLGFDTQYGLQLPACGSFVPSEYGQYGDVTYVKSCGNSTEFTVGALNWDVDPVQRVVTDVKSTYPIDIADFVHQIF